MTKLYLGRITAYFFFTLITISKNIIKLTMKNDKAGKV